MTTKRRLVEFRHSVVFVRGDLCLAHSESIGSVSDNQGSDFRKKNVERSERMSGRPQKIPERSERLSG